NAVARRGEVVLLEARAILTRQTSAQVIFDQRLFRRLALLQRLIVAEQRFLERVRRRRVQLAEKIASGARGVTIGRHLLTSAPRWRWTHASIRLRSRCTRLRSALSETPSDSASRRRFAILLPRSPS